MRTVVVFDLNVGVKPEDHEAWARSVDMPAVRSLTSASGFEAPHLLGSDATPPCRHVEIIDIGAPEGFGDDVSSAKMQQISKAFQEFADSPRFLVTRKAESGA